MYYYSQKFFHPCSASVDFSHRVPYKKSDNFYNKVCYGSDSHLSHAQVQMARELGMNPRKLGSLDNHKQERWKAPLPVFIEQCYRRRTERGRLPRRKSKSASAGKAPKLSVRKNSINRNENRRSRIEDGRWRIAGKDPKP